jgi:hypothetical protein
MTIGPTRTLIADWGLEAHQIRLTISRGLIASVRAENSKLPDVPAAACSEPALVSPRLTMSQKWPNCDLVYELRRTKSPGYAALASAPSRASRLKWRHGDSVCRRASDETIAHHGLNRGADDCCYSVALKSRSRWGLAVERMELGRSSSDRAGTRWDQFPNAYAPPNDFAGYPAYSYGYGTGYSSPVYGGYRYVAYHPVLRRHIYKTGVRRKRTTKYPTRASSRQLI